VDSQLLGIRGHSSFYMGSNFRSGATPAILPLRIITATEHRTRIFHISTIGMKLKPGFTTPSHYLHRQQSPSRSVSMGKNSGTVIMMDVRLVALRVSLWRNIILPSSMASSLAALEIGTRTLHCRSCGMD
jgi:hypothetical protein